MLRLFGSQRFAEHDVRTCLLQRRTGVGSADNNRENIVIGA